MFQVKGMVKKPTEADPEAYEEFLIEGSSFDTREDILPGLGIALSTTDIPISWEEAHGHVTVLRGYGKDMTSYMVVFKFDSSDFGPEEFRLLDGHRVAERIGILVSGQVEDDDRPSAIYFMNELREISYKPHVSGMYRGLMFGAAFFVHGARRGQHSKPLPKDPGAKHVEARWPV
ncbi:hypothetical protein D3C85_714800 [compost metagenome]